MAKPGKDTRSLEQMIEEWLAHARSLTPDGSLTAGAALDGLIDWISRPSGAALRSHFAACGFWVDVRTGDIPSITIGWASADQHPTEYFLDFASPQGSFIGETALGMTHSGGFITTTRIPFAAFEAVADCAADSRARIGPLLQDQEPSGDLERENPEVVSPTPGLSNVTKGAATTAPIDQPATDEATGVAYICDIDIATLPRAFVGAQAPNSEPVGPPHTYAKGTRRDRLHTSNACRNAL